MTRAEKAGFEAFPENIQYSTVYDCRYDVAQIERRKFIKGYEQGQKETIEKVLKWFNDTTYFGSSAGEEVKRFLMEDLRKAMEEE